MRQPLWKPPSDEAASLETPPPLTPCWLWGQFCSGSRREPQGYLIHRSTETETGRQLGQPGGIPVKMDPFGFTSVAKFLRTGEEEGLWN